MSSMTRTMSRAINRQRNREITIFVEKLRTEKMLKRASMLYNMVRSRFRQTVLFGATAGVVFAVVHALIVGLR